MGRRPGGPEALLLHVFLPLLGGQLAEAEAADAQGLGREARQEEALAGALGADHKAAFAAVVPPSERREARLRAAHADVRGLVGDPGRRVLRAGLQARGQQLPPHALLDVADPLLAFRGGGSRHHEGLLGRLDHPAVLGLQSLRQRLQCNLLQRNDVLAAVLTLVQHDAAVHQDVVEEEEDARFGLLAALLGQYALTQQHSARQGQWLPRCPEAALDSCDALAVDLRVCQVVHHLGPLGCGRSGRGGVSLLWHSLGSRPPPTPSSPTHRSDNPLITPSATQEAQMYHSTKETGCSRSHPLDMELLGGEGCVEASPGWESSSKDV